MGRLTFGHTIGAYFAHRRLSYGPMSLRMNKRRRRRRVRGRKEATTTWA
ncbi:hypothetical protein E2C01_084312 [Portunus trituberculatus]|uniref:Uncharacterized protein n=1 Tax=Portunus trituberculatus TaxID=210409 RepID=A0A5B7IXY3_PORTR|nr:hypothetical protein [Portunus trituberculatus]